MIDDRVRELVRMQLIRDEGVKKHPYTDTVGKLTIGVGRNLSDNGLSDEEVMMLLGNDIDEAARVAVRIYGVEFDSFTANRQAAIINMIFNLGESNYREFKKMIAAIKRGDWNGAANEASHSLWYSQVGLRAIRLVEMLRNG